METFKLDEGRAWWVLVACILGDGIISDGIGYSFGLIYTELLQVYSETNEVTSWIGSLQLASGCLFAIPVTYFVEKQGCRRATVAASLLCTASFIASSIANNIYIFYVTLGLMAGLGMMTVTFATNVAVQRAFDKKRLSANGIVTSGTGFGMLVMGPITGFLLSYYGLHGTFLIISGICLNGAVFGLLIPSDLPDDHQFEKLIEEKDINSIEEISPMLTENPNDQSTEYETFCDNDGQSDLKPRLHNNGYVRLLTNVQFILWTFGGIFYFTSMETVIVFIPDRVEADFQMSTFRATVLVTILGASHLLARPLLELINYCHKTELIKQMIYASLTLLSGIITVVSIVFDTVILQHIFVVLFGASSAICVIYKYPVLCDIIEMCDLEKAFGIYHTMEGFVYLGIIPISGWLKDNTGNYKSTFIMLGAVQIVSGCLLFCLPLTVKWKSKS